MPSFQWRRKEGLIPLPPKISIVQSRVGRMGLNFSLFVCTCCQPFTLEENCAQNTLKYFHSPDILDSC